MNYKFAQLIQTPGKRGKTATEVFIAQPDALREKLGGKLFILVEIDTETLLGQKIITFLIDSIVHNFYENEKLLYREKIPSIKVEHIFETALADTNKQLSEYIKEEKLPITFENINICAGVVHENDLFIANTGKNKAFLVYQEKSKAETGSYNIMDIFPKESYQDNQTNIRLFSNIVNGIIPPKGSLLICNEALPEYVSKKQLINIICSLPPLSAIEQLRVILNNINTYISFASIIIKSTSLETALEAPRPKTQTSNDSIAVLNKTEDLTDSLLTPSGMISLKKWLSFISNASLTKVDSKKLSTPLFLKDKIFMKRKSSLNKIKSIIQNFFSNLFKALFNLSKSISNKKILSSLVDKIPNNDRYASIIKERLSPILRRKKILLFLAFFFILASLYSINKTKNSKEIADNTKKYDEIISSIEQKQNQADASLLYNNNDSAKKLFNEIDALLETLPRDTEEQKNMYLEFRKKYDAQLEKIRIVTSIDEATELTDFNNLNSHSNAENIVYIKGSNKIYAADKDQKSLYIFDLFDNIPTTITEMEIPINNLSNPFLVDNDENIYYQNNDKLLVFDTKENDFEAVDTDIENPESIEGADTFNGILYMLDKKKNNVTKRTKTGNNYGTPSSWMVDEIDLSQGVDISIDGHIYVLKNSGEVIKLLRGSRVEFELGLSDPPLESPSDIFVSKTTDFMYILESSKNRLLVYNKKGEFVRQYMGKNMTNIRDFTVDEEKKIIYFLNGSKLLKINAVHF